MRFTDKVAIVTGGGAGMGKSAAVGFAKEGAKVFIFEYSEKAMNETVEKIKSSGGEAYPLLGDVTSKESIHTAVDNVLEKSGRIDILVNYAGGSPKNQLEKPFIEETEVFWDKIVELNLKSTMMFCQAVISKMIEQKYGKIVNFAAIAGKVGSRMVAYSAAKGGVIAFTKALAQEVAEFGINVNCICPGPIATPGLLANFGEEIQNEMATHVPLRRLGEPDEVGSAVLYLASDDAAFITGQPLAIDGGLTMV